MGQGQIPHRADIKPILTRVNGAPIQYTRHFSPYCLGCPTPRQYGKTEYEYIMDDLNGLQLKIKKIAILLFVIGIMAALFPFPSCAVSNDFLSDANFLLYKEKNRAPDFNLKDPDGNPTRLDAFQGKIVLLYFWTTW